MNLHQYLKFFGILSGLLLTCVSVFAQFQDADYDGVLDTGGQDKCPTTLSQIQGRRAKALDEMSGKEVVIRLPDNLVNYLHKERTPLEQEKTKWLNKRGEVQREVRRVEDKYGKYEKMSSKERKAKAIELDSVLADIKSKIDTLDKQITLVNPNTAMEFTGDLEDTEGRPIQRNVKVKIRIHVDVFGCLPDDDRDGSPNMVDFCPDYVGTVETNGCPDRDKDLIPDREDACPDVKGPKQTRGCPDRDKDTVPDKDDACPDTPGVVELNGCPDRDKDTVPDKDDACPDTPGDPNLKGCPDRDKDTVIDKEDKCPDEPGAVELQGCPDRDKDGVLDREDDCPDVPGPKENKGCPRILEKASKVQFEVNKAIILPVSFPILDELVKLLKEYPDANIALAGHTDSDGDDDSNLQLSKDRAKAVGDYLIEKGIAPDRISSTGYGETKPIDTNATPQGKAKNRRVEMKLSNRK
ncbi:MAG: OmpA family protein [Microscillaceae bacterium]|jgi:outer membrane protein OmpA-like peptidoglycan-associated protein|nr:OmpA family protein [Microscillaceae bacterium]